MSIEGGSMAKNIYVGNMNYATTEQELSDLFGEYGAVTSARIITDRMTGRSRGFGFVEMANDEEADAAIAALNGFDFSGRQLKINEAEKRPRGGGGPRY